MLGGHDVVVVARPKQAEAIRLSGFRLQDSKGFQTARPTAVVSSLPEAFPAGAEYELIVLATKAYDAPGIIDQLNSLPITQSVKLMTVQNGVGIEEVAAKALGAGRVLAAVLTFPLSVTVPGHVVVEHKRRGLGLAPVERGEGINDWVALFREAGIDTRGYKDYRAIKWSKLLLNLPANASCAILNRAPRVVYAHKPTFQLERAMLLETLRVMSKLKIRVVNLPGSPGRTLARALKMLPASAVQEILKPMVTQGRGKKLPSLFQDATSGRKQSEVLYLNGAVVQQGREVGVPTPVNFALADTLYRLLQGQLDWEDFRGKPAALLARASLAS